MYKGNFLDYPFQLYQQRVLQEKQEQLEKFKSVDNLLFCEDVVNNIGKPTGHPVVGILYYLAGSHSSSGLGRQCSGIIGTG